MIHEFAQPSLHARSHAAHVSENVVLYVNLERFQSDRRAYGMAAEGEAVAEHDDFFGLFDHRVVDCVGYHDGADRQVGGGKRFGAGEHVGRYSVSCASPHLASTAERANYL